MAEVPTNGPADNFDGRGSSATALAVPADGLSHRSNPLLAVR